MAVTKWVLSDPADMSSHTFAINPTPRNGSGDVATERPVIANYQDSLGTTVTLGQLILPTSKFQIEALTAAEHDALWLWFEKGALLTLTDDLNRTMTIVLTSFNVNRIRKQSNPFYRQITASFNVVTLVEA